MHAKLLWLLSILFFLSVAYAQFNFFEQMFGHGNQQQQYQQPRSHSSSGAGQWVAQSDSVSCAQYLCPATLVCVANPSDCPCPDVQDVKCLIPDAEDKNSATVVCARGSAGCDDVRRLSRRLE
ncbi:hypothetical protein WOLCODRAFT_100598 [Wolfiporia cocos MD-104 SS10]|uniref:Long chronological lifespan protein 2 n=1 Tax=Wolfiporia cocos (strain MD-104) TaxID=742152 RepID=A0A2H3JH12_WOLCO|nr:hypothetical protein WOLCODRAFT_100598 [Wolfiporia cocos MD-104 SS10]